MRPTVTSALGLGLLLGTLLNGIEPFLLRVGVLETEKFEAAWIPLCGPAGLSRAPFGLGARCATPPRDELLPVLWPDVRAAATSHTLRSSGPGKVLKLAKDACIIALAISSAWLFLRRPDRVQLRNRLPLIGLGAFVIGQSALGLARGEIVPVLSGLRSFQALPIALLLPPVVATSLSEGLARWVAATVALQVPLLLVEALRSLPVQKVFPFLFLPWRLSGSLVNPNSLGVFAVVGLAFVLCFERAPRWRALAVSASILCVAAAGSGAGWVALALVGSWQLWAIRGAVARTLAVTCIVGAVALLPRLTARQDVFESLQARSRAFRGLGASGIPGLLFGNALGTGTTTLATVDPGSPLGPRGKWAWAGESAAAALVSQTGLLGLCMTVAALSVAFGRDPSARLVISVSAACGLVAPLLDTFPANLLIALVLGRARVGGG